MRESLLLPQDIRKRRSQNLCPRLLQLRRSTQRIQNLQRPPGILFRHDKQWIARRT
jgi:hypothetical protein